MTHKNIYLAEQVNGSGVSGQGRRLQIPDLDRAREVGKTSHDAR